MKYIPPTSFEELQDFHKLDHHIDGEIWKSFYFNNSVNFEISNYGRLYNTETKKFRKSSIAKNRKHDINSIAYVDYFLEDGVRKNINFSVCDMMLRTFRSFISDTHVNPIPIDGNIFNLHLDNIKYVPNAYYTCGHIDIKEIAFIFINDEYTSYYIDSNGVITNDSGYEMRPNLSKAKSIVSIKHNDKIYSNTRAKWMALAFIPNPNNLKLASLIDKSNTVPSLFNIYWTNRRKN